MNLLNSGWHFQDTPIAASDMSCIVQVVELTDAHTARGLTLMMIYFYHFIIYLLLLAIVFW